jgi:hypothetical protein
VIDVDGQEPYDALIDHLGEEPLAPKVSSHQSLRHAQGWKCDGHVVAQNATPGFLRSEVIGLAP